MLNKINSQLLPLSSEDKVVFISKSNRGGYPNVLFAKHLGANNRCYVEEQYIK